MATKAPAKKTRVTAKHVAEHRAKASRDYSPVWTGCEDWDESKFLRHFQRSFDRINPLLNILAYYPNFFSPNTFINVMRWFCYSSASIRVQFWSNDWPPFN